MISTLDDDTGNSRWKALRLVNTYFRLGGAHQVNHQLHTKI